MKKLILKFGLALLSLGVFQSCLQEIKLPEKAEEKLQNEEEENLDKQPSTNEQKLPSTISTTYRKEDISLFSSGVREPIYYNLESANNGNKLRFTFIPGVIGFLGIKVDIVGDGSILGINDGSRVLKKGQLIGSSTNGSWQNNVWLKQIIPQLPLVNYFYYCGFKFVDLNGDLHYGYAKFKKSYLPLNGGGKFYIDEILQVSVQNTPNAPIKAGQI